MTRKLTNSHDAYLKEQLQDPEFAAEYLKAAIEENDMPEMFLIALRNIAEAKGMSAFAKKTTLNREGLYDMLSKNGNPRFKSLVSILDTMGLKLSVEHKKGA